MDAPFVDVYNISSLLPVDYELAKNYRYMNVPIEGGFDVTRICLCNRIDTCTLLVGCTVLVQNVEHLNCGHLQCSL